MEAPARDLTDLTDLLANGTLVALGDIHSRPEARQLAFDLLCSGAVQTLFIEFPNVRRVIDLGKNEKVKFNDWMGRIIDDIREKKYQALYKGKPTPEFIESHLILEGWFTGIQESDARPSLRALTALALSRCIRVFACDLSVERAKDRIREIRKLRSAGGEYDPVSNLDIVGPEGFAVRDPFAARKISKHSEGRLTGRLILWGDNHFQTYPVDLIVRSTSQDGEIKYEIVAGESSLKQELETRKNTTKLRVFRFDDITRM